ncbi:hypothetical protein B9Z51_00475 [Limnohabitans sp. T6-5]|nr:hypothetical protein B9Z51_00475 [Limnohabitans sp. T6-5]
MLALQFLGLFWIVMALCKVLLIAPNRRLSGESGIGCQCSSDRLRVMTLSLHDPIGALLDLLVCVLSNGVVLGIVAK